MTRQKGKKQVWILNREGGEAQQLTDTAQDVNNFAWAPGSDRLVLVLQDASPEEIEAAENKAKGSKAKPKPRPWVIDRVHFKEDEIGIFGPAADAFVCVHDCGSQAAADYFGRL